MHLLIRRGAARPHGACADRPVTREHCSRRAEGCDHAPREGHAVAPGVCTLGGDGPCVRDLRIREQVMSLRAPPARGLTRKRCGKSRGGGTLT